MKIKRKGQFVGIEVDEIFDTEKTEKFQDQPLFKAFIEDVNLTEITICSSNMGFCYTFTKIRE